MQIQANKKKKKKPMDLEFTKRKVKNSHRKKRFLRTGENKNAPTLNLNSDICSSDMDCNPFEASSSEPLKNTGYVSSEEDEIFGETYFDEMYFNKDRLPFVTPTQFFIRRRMKRLVLLFVLIAFFLIVFVTIIENDRGNTIKKVFFKKKCVNTSDVPVQTLLERHTIYTQAAKGRSKYSLITPKEFGFDECQFCVVSNGKSGTVDCYWDPMLKPIQHNVLHFCDYSNESVDTEGHITTRILFNTTNIIIFYPHENSREICEYIIRNL